MNKKRDALGKLRHRGVLFFTSVLLHSLLGLFPWQEKSRPLAVSSSPASPIPVIATNQLPRPPAEESQSLPTVIPPSPPAPAVVTLPPVALPPVALSPVALSPTVDPTVELTPAEPANQVPADQVPVPQAPVTQISEPVPEEKPHPDLAPAATPSATLSTDPPAPPASTPSVTPNDEAKIAADWESFTSHLQRQDNGFEEFTLLDIFNLFGEPEQANQFFDENNQPKLDISAHYLFPEQTPEQVLQTVAIPELTNNTGFELQPQDNFTSGLAYQLLQGEVLRYLIIVELNERSGSVLILSNSLPGLFKPHKF